MSTFEHTMNDKYHARKAKKIKIERTVKEKNPFYFDEQNFVYKQKFSLPRERLPRVSIIGNIIKEAKAVWHVYPQKAI